MSVLNNATNLLLGAAGSSTYQVSRSLRFNAADSAYLNRTPASAGNRQTWTWSGWVKRSTLGYILIFAAGVNIGSSGAHTVLFFNSDNKLGAYDYTVSDYSFNRLSTAVYRDLSAWYHIVIYVDSNNGTAANRFKAYVNGVEITAWDANTNAGASGYNTAANNTVNHYLSQADSYFDGYLADIHFIDGQALGPSSFTETSATTGQLIPKAYTGSYGTNGFKLNFSDNSTVAALGTDTSGNGNTWTVNNLSVTAGSGNDSLVDTPTSYGTGNSGGDVRGNYCTLNPLSNNTNTLANGNLDIASAAANAYSRCNSTIGISSGKWYFEILLNAAGTNSSAGIGQNQITSQYPGQDALSYVQELDNARKGNSDTYTAYGSALVAGDVFMCAFDLDNSKIFFGKNGTWFNSSNPAAGTSPAFTLATGTYTPIARPYNSNLTGASFATNFGQRTFAYTAPSGFKALCDTNLPTPVVTKPNTVMDVVLYTGTGAALTPTSSLGFNPDWIWIKSRSAATDHALYDVVRGAQARLESNTADAEVTTDGGVTAFNSAGFTLGTLAQVNTSSATYAAWCWDAGTSTVTNTAGSISSQVRANASAGFSVVTFTAQSSGSGTIGHGLGVTPEFVIVKSRADAYSWIVWHKSLTSAAYSLILNATAAQSNGIDAWNSTLPTSSVFSLGSAYAGASNSVAYCFAPVAGYSSFGSYTGNDSTDGPFVYTGFRPRWILFKNTITTGFIWNVYDAVRNTYNVANTPLNPGGSASETSIAFPGLVDILSNGFKIRAANATSYINKSAETVIYAAFAENPFQYARAR